MKIVKLDILLILIGCVLKTEIELTLINMNEFDVTKRPDCADPRYWLLSGQFNYILFHREYVMYLKQKGYLLDNPSEKSKKES
jgi:hypothetical protein